MHQKYLLYEVLRCMKMTITPGVDAGWVGALDVRQVEDRHNNKVGQMRPPSYCLPVYIRGANLSKYNRLTF